MQTSPIAIALLPLASCPLSTSSSFIFYPPLLLLFPSFSSFSSPLLCYCSQEVHIYRRLQPVPGRPQLGGYIRYLECGLLLAPVRLFETPDRSRRVGQRTCFKYSVPIATAIHHRRTENLLFSRRTPYLALHVSCTSIVVSANSEKG